MYTINVVKRVSYTSEFPVGVIDIKSLNNLLFLHVLSGI